MYQNMRKIVGVKILAKSFRSADKGFGLVFNRTQMTLRLQIFTDSVGSWH